MDNKTALDRRHFFKKTFGRLAESLYETEKIYGGECSKNDVQNKMNALWGDLSPELLQFEAKRLGIDSSNREEVLKALQKNMHGPKR
jgi:hypothetical protein